MIRNLSIFAFLTLISLFASIVSGQDKAAKKSALGVRQAQIERTMADIERKFATLAINLEATGVEADIQQAKKLRMALQKSAEFQIRPLMDKVTELLNESRLDEASSTQDKVIEKLDDLIKVLRSGGEDEAKKKQEEIDKLKKFKKELENILKEQKESEQESNKIANKDQTLDGLDKQIAKVKDLIKKQQKVNAETDSSANKGSSALDRIANRQHDVRKETEKVAEAVSKTGNAKVGKLEDKEPKGGEPKGGEPKGGEPKGGEPKGGEPKGGEPKGGEPKGGEPKGGEPKGGEPKGGEPKGGEPKGGEPKGGRTQRR